MSALVFVDTDVLSYARGRREPEKPGQARGWLAGYGGEGCSRIGTQVLSERCASLRRAALAMSAEAVWPLVRRDCRRRAWVVGGTTVGLVPGLQDRSRGGNLLLAAAAQHPGCRYLLSEGPRQVRRVDPVQIIDSLPMQLAQTGS